MGITYNTKIVRDGLVLCLDAANPKSYPGSGTTWTDLSGLGNTGTLTNGPTFSSANSGYLTFNGSTQYGSLTIPVLTTYSLCFWLYVVSLPASGERQIFGAPGDQASISLVFASGAWRWHSWSGSGSRTGNPVSTGQWYNFVMTRSGSVTNFFINGVLESQFASGVNILAGTGYIFEVSGVGERNLNGRLSCLSIYNRALTAAEIEQNFEAVRGRYGI